MHAHAPAEAIEVLNRLLKFFGDGERWIEGRLSDRRGKCCLVGALDFVSSHHAITGDAAEQYRPLPLPTRGVGAFVAMRMARTMPGCGRPFAARCGAKSIVPAKVS